MKSFNNNRKLEIYAKLMDGRFIDKEEEADFYCVSLKTIQRDLEAIRYFWKIIAINIGLYMTKS